MFCSTLRCQQFCGYMLHQLPIHLYIFFIQRKLDFTRLDARNSQLQSWCSHVDDGLPRENCWTEPDPASNLQRMHPSTQATVPPVPLPLVPVRWGRLTKPKPLYQFVHVIISGIQSILIFHHLLNMKEKRSILIFQGFEAAAAIKVFSAKIGSSHILFRRADSGSRGCIYAKQDKSTGQNWHRHPLQRPTGKQNMSNELAHCYTIFLCHLEI